MNKRLRNLLRGLAAAAVVVVGSVVVVTTAAFAPGRQANGQGTLINPDGSRRQFSFSAQTKPDGSVTGNATLHNHAFTAGNGNAPYTVQIDISCMKVVGNIAIFGGMPRRSNDADPIFLDAVFFTVQDNGEPGRNDKISLAYFWDLDPAITGDPGACQNTGPADFPLETINNGNIQVR